jgi:arylsulfatase
LLSIDALRADRLGCYGYHGAATSPTIDAWAKQALLFDHAYSQAPWTVPSLASLMSGRYAREVGAYTNLDGDIRAQEDTLPEQLHRLGYRTAFFNTNPLLMRPGIDRGFDSIAPPKTGNKIPYTSVEPLVMEWLDQHARDKFFLWIHDMDTHSPPTEGNPYRGKPGWDRYDAEVRWVDEAVQRLRAKLDALGILDQVLFIFTADHGEAFGEHQLSGHQDVIYDEVLRVPLIVQYPGMGRTGRVAAPVALLDVNPTIGELAGLPVTSVRRGESLVPLTATTTANVRHSYVFSGRYYFGIDRIDPANGKVLIARGTHHLAVHDDEWKLIAKVYATISPPEQPDWDTTDPTKTSYELYDLTTDPLERYDLFAGQPEVAARLQRALAAWKGLTEGGYRAHSAPNITPVGIDPATREALHSLGYD